MPATRKVKIPASLKAEVWQRYVGDLYTAKCAVTWCSSHVTPFTFEAGHNIPESKGGETNVDNLRPICGKCNKAMGNRYTIDEYSKTFSGTKGTKYHPYETCKDTQHSTYAIAPLYNMTTRPYTHTNNDDDDDDNENNDEMGDTAASSIHKNKKRDISPNKEQTKPPSPSSSSLYIHKGLFNVIACFGRRSNAVKPVAVMS